MKNYFRIPPKRLVAILLTIILALLSFETALAAGTITVNIPVYKEITGDTPLADETFTMRLTAVDGAPVPAGSVNGTKTVAITGEGNAHFGDITYTEPGDYRYTISEVAGGNNGYTYDDTVYELTVQVTWTDEAYGELQGMMYLVKQGGTDKQERAVFTNRFGSVIVDPNSDSVIVDPPVQKVIAGDSPSASSTFMFYLKANYTNNPMPAGSVNGIKGVSITGAGTRDFGGITYTKAGTYSYTVYEYKGNVGGYTYDTTVYTMTVTVTEEGGELSAVRTITNERGVSASDLIFTNQYSMSATPTPIPTPVPTPTTPTYKPDGPKTGDASVNYVWWILLGLSVIGMCAATYFSRKHER